MKKIPTAYILLFPLLLSAIAVCGCATHNRFMPLGEVDEYGDYRVSVTGQGVAPPDATGADHARVLARRAAEADAYRQLAEKLCGLEITAKYSTSKNMIEEDKLKLFVSSYLSGAEIERVAYSGGLAEVDMSVNVSRGWKRAPSCRTPCRVKHQEHHWE